MKKKIKKLIGWREYIDIPSLGLQKVKVKVDTGAKTSCLCARHMEIDGDTVSFDYFDRGFAHKCQAKLIDMRWIRSSSGHKTFRPVIQATLFFGELKWEAELSLVDRKEMEYRMLLGREALKKRFIVDVSKSFLLSKDI